MRIAPLSFPNLKPGAPVEVKDKQPGFKEALIKSLEETSELQQDAHLAMEKLASGRTKNLHETMMAVQKAEISFKMLTQVRNKILNAYQEIMRMQV
ncbi:MAG: flagellar hook-basal body complex protein FliE [Pseudomonadota bacterium]